MNILWHPGRHRGLRVLVAAWTAVALALIVQTSTASDRAGAAPVSPKVAPTCDQPSGPFQFSSSVVGIAGSHDDGGYWVADANGQVAACGDAPYYGEPSSLNEPIVGIAATPTGHGYYLVAADGGIFTYGDAVFRGSTGALTLNQPVVGMAVDTRTGGYWLVAADGGIFAFNAPFLGSTGSIKLNRPVVGMAVAPGGNGYWFVASDGGVFSFGVPFWGSTGAIHLNQSVVGMSVDRATGGYWLVAADGGIFAFHAPFFGSTGAIVLNQPIVGMESAPTGSGYRFVASDAGVFCFTSAYLGTPAFSPPPVLGGSFDLHFTGFDAIAPTTVQYGIDGYSDVERITWANWGAEPATGTGKAWFIPSGASSGDGRSEQATVVAFGLASCGSGPAYTKFTYYFPQEGEHFNPGYYFDACSGTWIFS